MPNQLLRMYTFRLDKETDEALDELTQAYKRQFSSEIVGMRWTRTAVLRQLVHNAVMNHRHAEAQELDRIDAAKKRKKTSKKKALETE